MKLHLPLNLLIALMTSFTGITLGTAASIEWDGGESNKWSAGNVWGDDNGNPVSYNDGDAVSFLDQEEGILTATVVMDAALTPGSVSFNNSDTDYVISSENGGVLAGAWALTKEGAGFVDMRVSNAGFAGEVFLNDGVLIASADNAFGTGSMTFDGGALYLGSDNVLISNALSGAVKIGVEGEDTVFAWNAANARLGGEGAVAFTKEGSGTLKISYAGETTYTNAIVIESGAIQFAGESGNPALLNNAISGTGSIIKSGVSDLRILADAAISISGDIIMRDGAKLDLMAAAATLSLGTGAVVLDNSRIFMGNKNLTLSTRVEVTSDSSILNQGGGNRLTLNGGLDIAEGKTLTYKTDYKNPLSVNGLSGGGVLMLERPAVDQQNDDWRTLTISGDGSGFTGTVVMTGTDFVGAVAYRNRLILTSDNALVNGKVEMKSNAQDLEINTANAHIAGVTGTGQIGATGGERTLTWRADEDQVFAGILADNTRTVTGGAVVDKTGSKLSLTKTGAGKLTLSGASRYTGLTTVSAGELAFTNAGGVTLGGGLTMAGGARLSSSGALNLTTGTALTMNYDSSITATGAFGAGTFTLTLNGLDGIDEVGEYTLISAAGGLAANSAVFNWDGYVGDGSLLYELQQSGTFLKLVVSSATDMWVWQNTPGMTWSDSNTGAQWGLEGNTETAAGQTLFFNSAGAGTVTVSGAVNPESVVVNNEAGADYVFVGEDDNARIASGTLTKNGEGKLTLNLDNTGWSGAISVLKGELEAQAAGSLGSGTVSINGGTLTLATADVQTGMGKITLAGGALNLASGDFATAFTADNLEWTGGSLTLGEDAAAAVTKLLANGKTVELAEGSVLTVSDATDNTALNLNASGTGTVSVKLGDQYGKNVLNMSTEFQGTLSVTEGYFQLNGVTMGADAVLSMSHANVRTEWNGTAGGTFANDIVFTGNQFHATKDVILSGDLSGTAFSTQATGNITLTGGVNMNGQLKVHRGTVTVNTDDVTKLGDSIDIQNNSKLAFSVSSSFGGVISGTAGSSLAVNGGTLELTGANTFLGTLAIAGGATALLGDGGSWAGAISGEGALVIDSTGNVTVTGGNAAFTGSTTLSGTGTVTLTDANSLGSGKVTVNNGVLNLASHNAGNAILITKGSLQNAGSKTTGNVEVAASAGTEGALNTINLGGLSGSMVSSIVMEDFSRLTGVTGVLDMTGKTVTLKLDSGSLSAGGAEGQGVIDADGLTLSAATTTIDLGNQAVLDLLSANRESADGVGLVLTTGNLVVDNYRQISFSPLLASLGYAVTEVLGVDGTLMVSGNTDQIYLVDTSPTSDSPNINEYAALDPYKHVGINGTTLHVNLDGGPDDSRGGEGLKISNLIGSNASLVVTNTSADAADNHAVVDLIQNVDAGDNSYGGSISGDHVDFIKKGVETLTVEGNFTGNDSMLNSTEGEIVLNGMGNSLTTLKLSGGDITLGGRNDGASRVTTAENLVSEAGGGTLDLGGGARLVLTGQEAGDEVTDVTISGNGTLTLGGEGLTSSLTLGNGSSLDGVLLDIREGSALSAANGPANNVSGLTGGGSLNLGGTEMTVNSTASHTFKGVLEGSGTLNFESSNDGVQTLEGAGNADYTLNVSNGGALTLDGAAAEGGNPAQASYNGITVNGGTLNIGSANVPKTQLTLGTGGLTVTGDSTVSITTSSSTLDGLGAPFVTSSGDITLGDGTGKVTLITNNLDTLISAETSTLNLELFKTTDGGVVSLGDDVTLRDMILGSMYDNLELTTNEDNTAIIITGDARTENAFQPSALTRNAGTGADLLWNARFSLEEGSTLRALYNGVLVSQTAGDIAGAARKLAAAAGSTVTALSIAQRDSMRDQMLWVRNRVAQMGVNPAYVNADMPYFHMWMQGTGSYANLDTKGDESGYKLTTWGGTVGMDADLNDHFTVGAAFTANYGDLTANAADTADGDLDSYYVNLFGRYQSRKWSHLLVLTGGWNNAKLTRTVDYGTGSYQAHGDTTGSGFGAMYELAYDIALNESKSVILQPLFNASIITTRMDGYSETGSAGNAGLRVEDQKLTTAALAAGVRLSGLVGSNIFGREALGEVRVNVSQDMGDRRGQANVGFLADPGYTRPVYGAKVGATAFQAGVGLSVPVGLQGVIYVDGNADIRSGSSSLNGSVGYRYSF